MGWLIEIFMNYADNCYLIHIFSTNINEGFIFSYYFQFDKNWLFHVKHFPNFMNDDKSTLTAFPWVVYNFDLPFQDDVYLREVLCV